MQVVQARFYAARRAGRAELFRIVCSGVAIYISPLFYLWRLAGVPAGAEIAIIARLPWPVPVQREHLQLVPVRYCYQNRE